MSDLAVVYPARVVGTNVVHLARYEPSDPTEPASTPRLARICGPAHQPGCVCHDCPRAIALELVPEDAPPYVVDPACLSWLREVNPAAVDQLLR